MFCEKCGNALPDSARFCSKCGNKIKDSIPAIRPNKKTMNAAKPISEMLGKERIGDFLKDANLQKVAEDVKKNGNTILGRIQKWIVDYLQTWQEWTKLQKKEQYIWFGIHGGVVLLILCIVIISSSGKSFGNIARDIEEVVKDGEISEEDITFLAQRVKSYDDVEAMREIVNEIYKDGRAEKYGLKKDSSTTNEFLNLSYTVERECITLSEFAPMSRVKNWYDKDGLVPVLYGIDNNDEYITLYQCALDFVSHAYDQDENISVSWYVYEGNNKITFVKTTTTHSNGESEYTNDIYEGNYQISDTELVITLNGQGYHLREADTDIAAAEEIIFQNLASGYWKCTGEFYAMLMSELGINESEEFGDSRFFEVQPSRVLLRDENGEIVSIIDYNQGAGNTVEWNHASYAIEFSYSREGDTLTMTIEGRDYSLAKAKKVILDEDKYFWGKKGGFIIQ